MTSVTDLPETDIDLVAGGEQPLQTSSLATRLPFGFAKRFCFSKKVRLPGVQSYKTLNFFSFREQLIKVFSVFA